MVAALRMSGDETHGQTVAQLPEPAVDLH
jgi:hypothetical protein